MAQGNGLLGAYKDRPNVVGDAFNHLQGIHDRLQEHTDLLTKLVSKDIIEAEGEEFSWLRHNGITDAAGQVQIPIENRTGYERELVSWASVGPAAASGGLLFFMGAVENPNLLWAASVTQYASDKFRGGMIIPVNGVIVAQFLAMGNAQQVWVNVLTRKAVQQQGGPYRAQPRKGW